MYSGEYVAHIFLSLIRILSLKLITAIDYKYLEYYM